MRRIVAALVVLLALAAAGAGQAAAPVRGMEADTHTTDPPLTRGGAATPQAPKARDLMFKLLIQAQTSLGTAAAALSHREDGQTMAEYGVVLAVIVLTVMTAITMLSTSVQGTMGAVAGFLP
jgi:Flp pilus assembly pilin Flp